MRSLRLLGVAATAGLLVPIGCQPEAAPAVPTLASQEGNANETSPAEVEAEAEEAAQRWNFTAPSLMELHRRWEEPLAESDAEFVQEIRRLREGGFAATRFSLEGEAGPLSLPPLDLASLEDADRPMERSHTQDRYCERSLAIWMEEIDTLAESHGLREDETETLRAMARTLGCDKRETADQFDEAVDALRQAGTEEAVLQALIGLHTVRAAEPGALRVADLAELVRAADAAASDESVPGALRFRASLWALLGAATAEAAGFADDEDAEAANAFSVSKRVAATADGLRTFAASVTPEAVAARPQLPRFLYHNAWEVICRFPANGPADDPPRLALAAALSDGAADGGDPYAFHAVLCGMLSEAGFEARGGEVASEVTEEGWEGLHRFGTAAGRHGHAAWLAHPNLPVAPTLLQRVSRGGGSPVDERLWFAEAVAAQVDFESAYSSIQYGLLPRWGGSHQEMIELAQSCLRDDLRETDTPRLGLEMVRAVADDLADGYGPPPPGPWRKTLAAYADFLTNEYEEGGLPIDGSYGRWAKRVGGLSRSLADEGMPDRQLAVLKLWPDSDFDPIQLRPVLDGYRRAFVAGPLAAAEGEAAEQAARLAEKVHPDAPILTHDEVRALKEDVAAVRAAAGDDPLQRDWLVDVEQTLSLLDSLYQGKTVGPVLGEALAGWRCGASWFRVTPGDAEDAVDKRGSVDLYGSDRGSAPYLSLLAKLPEPFAFNMVVHIDAQGDEMGRAVGVGVGPGVWTGPSDLPAEFTAATGGSMLLFQPDDRSVPGYVGYLPFPWDRNRGYAAVQGFGESPPDYAWVSLGVMAEPGRVATFAGQYFMHEATETAPPAVQPLRLGPENLFDRPLRWQVRSFMIRRCPDFVAPFYLRQLPPHIETEPPPEDAEMPSEA
ncbi:hypothetical protein [Alienimonas californiensis]|uniref:Uncharacterized protein n=1 Tax=Alienimonas californiensis TaxID=2527989 RepID=A0A517PEH0_9PLAN|nr:hypothetical protein [Alienimonas californiensis]QDT17767.1 hypothetical protein CA12_39000 [Alienimonas californiensis]